MVESPQPTTAELAPSKTRAAVITEAKRIEESLLYSSKRHFVAAGYWTGFHMWLGIPIVVMSAIAGASALSTVPGGEIVAGVIAIFVAALTGVSTFLNANERAGAHRTAGAEYDALMNAIRIFYSIDCWRDTSEQVLTEGLKTFSEKKDELNRASPHTSRMFYKIAKRGIKRGEADYAVDHKKKRAGSQ